MWPLPRRELRVPDHETVARADARAFVHLASGDEVELGPPTSLEVRGTGLDLTWEWRVPRTLEVRGVTCYAFLKRHEHWQPYRIPKGDLLHFTLHVVKEP